MSFFYTWPVEKHFTELGGTVLWLKKNMPKFRGGEIFFCKKTGFLAENRLKNRVCNKPLPSLPSGWGTWLDITLKNKQKTSNVPGSDPAGDKKLFWKSFFAKKTRLKHNFVIKRGHHWQMDEQIGLTSYLADITLKKHMLVVGWPPRHVSCLTRFFNRAFTYTTIMWRMRCRMKSTSQPLIAKKTCLLLSKQKTGVFFPIPTT